MKKISLSRFRPQSKNANRHTQRGLKMLDDSMSEDGYVSPMTATADGEIIDGSARLERVAERFKDVDPIIIEHDGTRPIIAVRTDIPNANTPEAKRIALRANRIAQVDLDWDVDVLKGLESEMDLSFLEMSIGKFNYEKEWEGMPEFNQENKEGFTQIIVHFDSEEDFRNFAVLLDQKITNKTKSIWYPERERERLRDFINAT